MTREEIVADDQSGRPSAQMHCFSPSEGASAAGVVLRLASPNFSAEYGKHIPNDEEAVLREWNKQDAVDAGELARDQRISTIQGNLNQFVEHAEPADRIQDF